MLPGIFNELAQGIVAAILGVVSPAKLEEKQWAIISLKILN